MVLRMRVAGSDAEVAEEAELYLPDAELASLLRTATRLIGARVSTDDRIQAVLGTVAAELGVACGRLYDRWDEQERTASEGPARSGGDPRRAR